ncbi:hypothetical protein N0V90_004063 [Kalmusia sp. IMI 367209]|nr:hypothetical protein N0V90_004063 [Kalmusia sp. IMI 367209]
MDPVRVSSAEEELHFEFFKNHTADKLPGTFGSSLWNCLIIQICSEEPAVLHAVLGYSAHRRKVLDDISRSRAQTLPDKQEEFMLRHYCKAIDYLKPEFHVSGTRSIRTALIACLIFIYLEFLRGNYNHACEHLQGGTSLLRELRKGTSRTSATYQISSSGLLSLSQQESIDDFLSNAFARVQIQVEYSGYRLHPGSAPKVSQGLPAFQFYSQDEARHYLAKIFEGTSLLARAFKHGAEAGWPAGYQKIVETDQRLTQGALDTWLMSYNATIADLTDKKDLYELFGYQMLRLYHTMSDIMVSTCSSQDQSVFDQHNSTFLSIVTQGDTIISCAASFDNFNKPHANDGWLDAYTCHRCEWVDVRWMPPLYYTALKCRDHSIRTQALRLMSSSWRNEKDLEMALVVAEEVVRMEEGDFFAMADYSFDKQTLANQSNLRIAEPLPEERRFDVVEMIVHDGDRKSLQIACKKQLNGRVRIVRKSYDEASGTWVALGHMVPLYDMIEIAGKSSIGVMEMT